jgi:hypothetical protein
VAQFARLGNPSREGECRVQRAAQLQESGDTLAADAERAAAQRILDDVSIRYGPQVFALLPQVDGNGQQRRTGAESAHRNSAGARPGRRDSDERYLLDTTVGRIAIMICEDLNRVLTLGADARYPRFACAEAWRK